MRLFELEQLPAKAGVATITWGKGLPRREEAEITLPEAEETQFFPLQKGAQFLVVASRGPNYDARERLYFGGTDERPFLVEMNPQVLTSLKKGEAGFYDAIRPEGAQFAEKKFGTKAVRQGDWFAVPLPFKWNSVHGLLGLFTDDHKATSAGEKGIRIGGTRHQLIDGQAILLGHNPLRCMIIGEGLLRAPDHADKVLKGPHAFFQTQHLKEPEKAD